MIPAALIVLQLVARAQSEPEPPWLAPPSESAASGDFGVAFKPRYPDLASASAIRQRDIDLLARSVDDLDPVARARQLAMIEQRRQAVRGWQDHFEEQVDNDTTPLRERVRSSELEQILSLEASTLELQIDLLKQPHEGRSPRAAFDRISVGDTVTIGASERVRDAIAVGGDVIVEGHVEHDAVAVWGDIEVRPGGVIDGDTVVVGGSVRTSPGVSLPAPAVEVEPVQRHRGGMLGGLSAVVGAAISFLSLAGVSVLIVGLFPAPVARVASTLHERPLRSLAVGVFGSLTLLVISAFLAITLVGIPVALLLLAVLGLSWLVGVVGLSQELGDRLPLPSPQGRWLALVVITAGLSTLGWLPTVLSLVLVIACIAGTGAALMSRIHRAGSTR